MITDQSPVKMLFLTRVETERLIALLEVLPREQYEELSSARYKIYAVRQRFEGDLR